MKYKVTVEFDSETGDYDLLFNNLTDKSQGVDYNMIMKAMRKIFGDFEKQMGQNFQLAPEPRMDN